MSGRPIVLEKLEYTDRQIKVLSEKLLDICAGFNISLSSQQAQDCLLHLLYVEQINSYINLTRITDLDEAIVLHLLDSLLLARYFDSPDLTYLDMGTGAGFPGVPLAIATGAKGTFIDSVGKKVNAVNAIIKKLQLDRAAAVHTRIEEYAVQYRGFFDIVVARALASMPILIEYAAPFLCKHGHLVISKGNPEDNELSSAQEAASICGLQLVQNDSFDLPSGLGHREVFIFERVSNPSISLPRPNGMARKNPLV